jgi:Rod binding domain-containing protein
MDISINHSVLSAATANNAQAAKTTSSSGKAGISDAAAEKAAKGFESVLLNKLFDAMQATVPESGLFEEGGMEQTQGIFWMYLAQDVGSKGGLGLWKQLYNQIKKDGLGSSSVPQAPSSILDSAQNVLDTAADFAGEATAW